MAENEKRTLSGVTVEIDSTMCIGSGSCVNVAPEVFEIQDDNLVHFQDDTPDIDQDRLIEACTVCPVDALIVEQEGERIVP